VLPITGLYHWFDGDGMLHGVRLARGRANYSNLLVNTVRLQNERRLGAFRIVFI
jgi:carotenoid cleavage dioxygenase